ncbi:collagen alpha-1(I) chain-like [Ochotona princeps]|uniref:collagen alpha-1(I) chain-like n=1 Tax=Ochotona princeps TaxID=9978 RepID=UPI002714A931|nr:collagen alpha-1(I) chain-like [Ochotona princeps]
MAERRGGLGARLARLLAGLGARRGRRGKVTSEEARSQNRPWGGQSCPDLAQGQGSTTDVSLKAQARSCSEWDLQTGSHNGFRLWKQQHICLGETEPVGRLSRPAVGSASDLASWASLQPERAEPIEAQHPSHPGPTLESLEQGTPGCHGQHPRHAAAEVPLTKLVSDQQGAPLLPRPMSFPGAVGAKGDPSPAGPAPPGPAQAPCTRTSARRTRYRITITLQGCEQAPGEAGEEPAQPAPHPCGSEESRGWQEPSQGPRPITGCPTDPPWRTGVRAGPHQGNTAQRHELPVVPTLESPHRR